VSLGGALGSLQVRDTSETRSEPVPLDPDYDESGIYTADGEIEIAGDTFKAGALLVFRPGDRITITAQSDSRFMMQGGDPMDGPRFI
jgi:redox-sensitive bicupin YhaK (pirin superfamily)